MTKRKLPIGIRTFRTIREEGWYYVDKTAYAHRLMGEGKHYFLSRPMPVSAPSAPSMPIPAARDGCAPAETG